ncbi:MAG: hypothetical protein DI628_08590 [Blastochloris viridis]|uniref:Uncharacterized protein n=1 Tax=Blastochloris viridis TaxID=1079 RepID=A0A6N4R635_BLAVI|nr:MAG: hypothetical protein DI628_08590 [Blastochloris viridis]
MFIFSLFTFVLALMGSIISFGSKDAAILTDERIKETGRFFEAMAQVIKTDVTQKYLTANPNNHVTIANYITGLPEVAAMSAGLYNDVGVDAWGKPLQGAIVTEYQLITASADANSAVSVPVTAIAFVSSGPDGVLQTVMPLNPTTINQVRNIVAPSDAAGRPTSDDIVYTFDNREDQMRQLQTLHAHMERIGTASLKEYQYRVSDFRAALIKQYETDVALGKAVAAPDMNLANQPNPPKMLSLDSSANRYKLGVDEDIAILERTLASGRRMVLSAVTPATATAPLVLTLTNSSSSPTPWGTSSRPFRYVVRVFPDKI